jgi:hypothetical protein
MRLVDDERRQLRGRTLVFDRRRDLQMSQARDVSVDVGHDQTIADDAEPFEPSFHGASVRGIAELSEQPGNRIRVLKLRVPDRQTHPARLRGRAR